MLVARRQLVHAATHRLDRVRGRSTWLPDEYGLEVAEHTFVGWQPEAAVETAASSGWGLVGQTCSPRPQGS